MGAAQGRLVAGVGAGQRRVVGAAALLPRPCGGLVIAPQRRRRGRRELARQPIGEAAAMAPDGERSGLPHVVALHDDGQRRLGLLVDAVLAALQPGGLRACVRHRADALALARVERKRARLVEHLPGAGVAAARAQEAEHAQRGQPRRGRRPREVGHGGRGLGGEPPTPLVEVRARPPVEHVAMPRVEVALQAVGEAVGERLVGLRVGAPPHEAGAEVRVSARRVLLEAGRQRAPEALAQLVQPAPVAAQVARRADVVERVDDGLRLAQALGERDRLLAPAGRRAHVGGEHPQLRLVGVGIASSRPAGSGSSIAMARSATSSASPPRPLNHSRREIQRRSSPSASASPSARWRSIALRRAASAACI